MNTQAAQESTTDHGDPMHALMVRYVDGDPAAFRQLMRRVEPRIRAYLRRRVNTPELVDDLVQQTLLRVHVSRGCYDERWVGKQGAVERWFLTTAKRTMLDHFRSEYRRQTRLDTVCNGNDTEGFGGAGAPVTPEEHLSAEEELAQLQTSVRLAVDALPPRSREVVRRHKLEGEPIPRIADELGVATVSLRVRAHRAYRKLAQALAPLREVAGVPLPR